MEPTSPVARPMPREALVAFAGAAGLALGSFLPWVKVTAPFIGSVTKSGMEGSDGWLTLLAAAGIAFIAYRWTQAPTSSSSWIGALVVSALAAAVVIYEYADINSALSEVDSDFVSAGVGVGLHLCAAGTVASGVAAFLRRSQAVAPPLAEPA